MRGNAQRYASREPTRLDKLNALKMFLCSCRDEALAIVTVDQLVVRHRCDRKTTEYELTIERQRRASRSP